MTYKNRVPIPGKASGALFALLTRFAGGTAIGGTSDESWIEVVDLERMRPLALVSLGQRHVCDLALDPTGRRAYVVDTWNAVFCVDLVSGSEIAAAQLPEAKYIAISPSRKRVYAAASERLVTYDFDLSEISVLEFPSRQYVPAFKIDRGETQLALLRNGYPDAQLLLIDPSSLEKHSSPSITTIPVRNVRLTSPYGMNIVDLCFAERPARMTLAALLPSRRAVVPRVLLCNRGEVLYAVDQEDTSWVQAPDELETRCLGFFPFSENQAFVYSRALRRAMLALPSGFYFDVAWGPAEPGVTQPAWDLLTIDPFWRVGPWPAPTRSPYTETRWPTATALTPSEKTAAIAAHFGTMFALDGQSSLDLWDLETNDVTYGAYEFQPGGYAVRAMRILDAGLHRTAIRAFE